MYIAINSPSIILAPSEHRFCFRCYNLKYAFYPVFDAIFSFFLPRFSYFAFDSPKHDTIFPNNKYIISIPMHGFSGKRSSNVCRIG